MHDDRLPPEQVLKIADELLNDFAKNTGMISVRPRTEWGGEDERGLLAGEVVGTKVSIFAIADAGPVEPAVAFIEDDDVGAIVIQPPVRGANMGDELAEALSKALQASKVPVLDQLRLAEPGMKVAFDHEFGSEAVLFKRISQHLSSLCKLKLPEGDEGDKALILLSTAPRKFVNTC